MAINAAGLEVSGEKNPNWKGGMIEKVCAVCGAEYRVKRVHASSRFCSMKCVGISQRGINPRKSPPKRVEKACSECGKNFEVYRSHVAKYHCCSPECSSARRSRLTQGDNNPSWSGGVSRLPYPWDFRKISAAVIKRDGCECQNPSCRGADRRMTTHHINYDKGDCRPENLIALCSSCNSRANYGRKRWQEIYEGIMAKKKDGGGWTYEVFE